MSDEFESDEKRPRRKKPADDESDYEDDDDRPRKRRKSSPPTNDAVSSIIPYKNVLALVSYYTGVFGLISCFLFGFGGIFGIVPVITGVLALVKAGKDAEARGRAHAWIGIALGALELLVCCGASGYVAYMIATDGGRKH
jgi:hypothetical protein